MMMSRQEPNQASNEYLSGPVPKAPDPMMQKLKCTYMI